MLMGDTVVFEDEITPAMDAAFAAGGIETVTAPVGADRAAIGEAFAAAGTDIAGARWLELCAMDPIIFAMMRSIYVSFELDRGMYGHAMGSYARMLRWQRELEAR